MSIGFYGESRNIWDNDDLCSDCSINSDMGQSRHFLQFPFSFHRWMRQDSETRCSGFRRFSGWASWRLGVCADVPGTLASLGKLLVLVPRAPSCIPFFYLLPVILPFSMHVPAMFDRIWGKREKILNNSSNTDLHSVSASYKLIAIEESTPTEATVLDAQANAERCLRQPSTLDLEEDMRIFDWTVLRVT